VTDQAKLIRLPLSSLRVIGRGSAGVRLFHVADEEHVVSAVRLDEQEESENAAEETVIEEMVARNAEEPPITDEPAHDADLDGGEEA